MKEDIEEACNTAFTCLGFGFAGREVLVDQIVKESKTEHEAVQKVVTLYGELQYPDEKNPISLELFEELVTKILESRSDLGVFFKWITNLVEEYDKQRSTV